MKYYQQKTVLITGASSGIGEAFAQSLSEKGARLILTARRRDRLEAIADRLRAKSSEVMVLADDLGDAAAPQRIHREIESRGWQVDVLINNAGFGHTARFDQADLGTMQQMLQVNVNALVGLTRLCLPGMLQRRHGGVINIASTAAFQPVPFMAAYGASKAFVLNFSEALWAECQPAGVNVLALCPGYTASAFHAVAGSDVAGVTLTRREQVVEEGLQALIRGKCSHVVGTGNYFLVQSSRLLPRSTMARATRSMMEKRVASSAHID